MFFIPYGGYALYAVIPRWLVLQTGEEEEEEEETDPWSLLNRNNENNNNKQRQSSSAQKTGYQRGAVIGSEPWAISAQTNSNLVNSQATRRLSRLV